MRSDAKTTRAVIEERRFTDWPLSITRALVLTSAVGGGSDVHGTSEIGAHDPNRTFAPQGGTVVSSIKRVIE